MVTEKMKEDLTFNNKALDLFTQQTHEPRHNTPPGILKTMRLLDFQDPIPDTADTGRHLMRMESEDRGGSEAEET
jgi:hypothetical protein